MTLKNRIENFPVVKQLVNLGKSIKLPWLHGLSLYELLELYITGIIEGALTTRAAAIAFSFFMALFPFALFILNLIPYIPLKGFQNDFMEFLSEAVPPNTYEAISKIIYDILHNSYNSLLSTGFVMSVFLMTNGVNAILGGFENSAHVLHKRGYFRQYFVSLGLSIILAFLLLITVATIVVFEVFIQKTKLQDVLSEEISIIETSRYIFLILMILIGNSFLFKFGIKNYRERSFISIGSVFTTILIAITSYFFGLWVIHFSKYNQLYGSIGTLLIVMFYIWINSMILLLGFELNAIIHSLKIKGKNEQTQLEL